MSVPPKPKLNEAKVFRSQAGSPIAPKVFQPMPSHQQISARAYEIYQSSGYADGRDQQDWFQAEREMFAIQE